MLNPGPLEARAGCTLGAVQAVHLMLREREHCPGEHGGGGGVFSVPDSNRGDVPHHRSLHKHCIQNTWPGQRMAWHCLATRREAALMQAQPLVPSGLGLDYQRGWTTFPAALLPSPASLSFLPSEWGGDGPSKALGINIMPQEAVSQTLCFASSVPGTGAVHAPVRDSCRHVVLGVIRATNRKNDLRKLS